MHQLDIKKQVLIAVLVALATSLHLVESLLPPLPFPGAKLGLANIATIIGLYLLGPIPALTISLLRSLLGTTLGGILFGPGFWMSIAGASVSAIAMGLGYKTNYFRVNLVSLSLLGAISHATAQLLVAVFLTHHAGLWVYYPLLLGLSMITGVFTGDISARILSIIPYYILQRRNSNA